MTTINIKEFKRYAVRIALTGGLTGRRVVSDLEVWPSTLGKRLRAVSDEAKVPERNADILLENERLRKSDLFAPFQAKVTSGRRPQIEPDAKGARCKPLEATAFQPAARSRSQRQRPRWRDPRQSGTINGGAPDYRVTPAPGECNLRLVDRSNSRLPVVIVAPISKELLRSVETAPRGLA